MAALLLDMEAIGNEVNNAEDQMDDAQELLTNVYVSVVNLSNSDCYQGGICRICKVLSEEWRGEGDCYPL